MSSQSRGRGQVPAGQEQRGIIRWWPFVLAILLTVAVTPTLTPLARADDSMAAHWADTYGTKILLKRDGEPDVDISGGNLELQDGDHAELEFHWEVGKNPLPAPHDVLSVALPDWVRVARSEPIAAGEYTSCHSNASNNSIQCEFTPAVQHREAADLRGHFAVNVVATADGHGGELAWGTTQRARTTMDRAHHSEVATGPVTLSGVRTVEHQVPLGSGQRMVQVLWNLAIPASHVTGAGTINIQDSLASVNTTDPDTGQTVAVPQYLAPADSGPLTVSRIENGDEQVVAHVNGPAGTVLEGPGRHAETVTVEGLTGGAQWKPQEHLNVRIDSPTPDASYLVTFHTVVPSLALPAEGDDNPVVTQYAMVDDRPVSGEVRLHTDLADEHALNSQKTDVVLKARPETEQDVEFANQAVTVNYRSGSRSGTCAVTPAQPCYLAGFAPGEPIELSEVEPAGVKDWKPGRFDTAAKTEGDERATSIVNTTAGERIVVTLTRPATVPPSALIVRKELVGELPADFDDRKEFPVHYQCDLPSIDGRVRPNTPTPIKVRAGGEGTVAAAFPQGTKCHIVSEDQAAVQHNGYTLTDADLGGDITIAEDSNKNKITIKGTYAKDEDHLRVALSVAGDGQDVAKRAHETLPFTFTCSDGQRGTIDVPHDGRVISTPQRFPAGTECTVEADEPAAHVDNLQLSITPEIAQRSTIGNAEPLKFTASYATTKATLHIKKSHHGDGPAPGTVDSRFRYRCGSETGRVLVPNNGQPVEALTGIPVGTQCTIEEDPIAQPPAGFADITPAEERTKEITLDNDGVTTAEFASTYTRERGTFEISRTAVERGGDKLADTTDFDYTCTHPADNEINGQVRGVRIGEAKQSEEIPTGYTCRVTTNDQEALVTDVGAGVRIAKDNTPRISVTELYAPADQPFTLTKILAEREGAPAGHNYEYQCRGADDAEVTGMLGPIGPGQRASSEPIPAGHNCVVNEQPGGDGSVTQATLGQDSTTEIARSGEILANLAGTYSDWRGSLEITADTRGVDNLVPQLQPSELTGHYSCVRADTIVSEGKLQLKPGETARIEGIPAYADCSVDLDPRGMENRNSNRVRLDPAASIIKAGSANITSNGGNARVALHAAYVELGHFKVTKHNDGQRCDFDMVATWNDNGIEYSKEFTLQTGASFDDFPAIPVGTKIQLKQQHPAGDNYQRWCTPAYNSSHAGSVKDERNGIAEFSIVPNTPENDPQRITLNETKEIPWWWLIVPLALLPGGEGPNADASDRDAAATATLGPSGIGNQQALRGLDTGAKEGSGDGSNGGGAVADDQETGTFGQRLVGPIRDSSLAKTGASILGILAVSALAVGAGFWLIRRRR